MMRLPLAVLAAIASLFGSHHERAKVKHHHRHFLPRRPWSGPVIASWYYDQVGQTACGFHARYGFASLFLPCGARVQMRGPGGVVTAVMQDHGPYIGGRTFDLNPALKAALGCSDLCSVQWRTA